MNDERDELIDRAARVLATMPPVKAGATARVLMAVRANRARPLPLWRRATRRMEDTAVSMRVAGLLVAASLTIGFFARGTVDGNVAPLVGALGDADITLQPAGGVPPESRPVPVAMAVELRNARSVAVVGDFNGWDPSATPMQRVGSDGPWLATVLAKPGRHVYAFMVDGTTLVADPRAPRAKSADFGGDASVIMVRTP